jgi:hypothetical protein
VDPLGSLFWVSFISSGGKGNKDEMEDILVTVGAQEVKVITDVVYTVEVVYSVVDSEVDSETEELVVDVTSPPWVEVGLGNEVDVVVEFP